MVVNRNSFGRNIRSGSVLVITLIIMALLMILSVGIADMIILNMKGLSQQKIEFLQFEDADGGIYAVAGWMYFFKRADVPKEVTNTEAYTILITLLANTVRYPQGYSSAWKGFDVKLNSMSGPTEIESVVFVPVSPAGYGNE